MHDEILALFDIVWLLLFGAYYFYIWHHSLWTHGYQRFVFLSSAEVIATVPRATCFPQRRGGSTTQTHLITGALRGSDVGKMFYLSAHAAVALIAASDSPSYPLLSPPATTRPSPSSALSVPHSLISCVTASLSLTPLLQLLSLSHTVSHCGPAPRLPSDFLPPSLRWGRFGSTSCVGERPLKAKGSWHRWITLLCFLSGSHKVQRWAWAGAEGFRCCSAKQPWIMKQRWGVRGGCREATFSQRRPTDPQQGRDTVAHL